jgi:uncharacterized protein
MAGMRTTLSPRSINLRPVWRALGALAALAFVLALWVGSGLLVPPALAVWRPQLTGFVTIFLGIFIEALPFLLAGTLVSSALHLFVSSDSIQRMCPRNPAGAAVSGSLLGLLFPVCECGSVPATRRLLSKGAPLPLGIAFVLASPVVNPIVIASTWVAFNGDALLVGGRIGLTIVVAVAVALLLGLHPKPQLVLAQAASSAHDHEHHEHGPHCSHEHHHEHDHGQPPQSLLGKVSAVLHHTGAELFEMSRYLIIGALLAAALQTLVPQSTLLALGQGPVVSVLVLMALAVVLSICSTVDAFVALAFVGLFSPGAILAFLVFGPMVDIKSTLLYTSTFSRRTVALLVLLTFQLILLAGVAVNLWVG